MLLQFPFHCKLISDDKTFKDILRFISNHQLLQVKAIIWNIVPNCRRDALLAEQAKLINLFMPKDIWHNVLIVCKQSKNPVDDAQGALAAARELNPEGRVSNSLPLCICVSKVECKFFCS